MSTATTHIKTEKRSAERSRSKLVPELRFKEFNGDWSKERLGNKVEIKSGISPSSYDLKETGSIPFFKVEELNNCEKYQVDSRFYAEEGKNLVPFGSIIFPKRGAAILNNKVRITEVDSYMDSNLMALMVNEENNCEFLFYFLLKEQLFKIADTSTIPQINNKHIEPYPCVTPSLPEQQKIASFLSAVDEKIQQLTKKKQLLEQYKKGVMQQLFSGHLRFKDENGNPYPDWEEKRLKDVLHEHKTKNKDGSVTEVFSVAKQKGVVNQIEHLGRSFAAATTLHYKVAFPGDLIYTKSPTKDFPFGIIKQNLTGRKGLVSPLYVVTTPQTNSLGFMFHCYFLSWVNVYNYLVPLIQKGAKNTMNINNDEYLNGAKFMLPVSEKEQQKIARYLSSIDTKIESVKIQITQTQTFKKGLLQQMFV